MVPDFIIDEFWPAVLGLSVLRGRLPIDSQGQYDAQRFRLF
ncbi:MAG: hypothetical protein ACI9B9_001907, partial [Halioglobus sp.]